MKASLRCPVSYNVHWNSKVHTEELDLLNDDSSNFQIGIFESHASNGDGH